MKIIAVANQKGGSGKTTTVSALAQAAAANKKRVLAVDLDPQGNLSYSLGADTSTGGTYAMLTGGAPAAELIQETAAGVDVVPSSWSLQTITTEEGSAWRLAKALAPLLSQYDLIFIDTPPTPGELQYNALLASSDLIIPVPADPYGLQGLYQMYQTAEHMAEANPALSILGIIITRHNGRSTLNRQMAAIIGEKAAELGLPVLGAVHEAVAIREAVALQAPLYQYAPNSKPAADYMDIYQKYI